MNFILSTIKFLSQKSKLRAWINIIVLYLDTEWNEITNPEKLLKISIQIVLPSEGFRLLGRPLYKKTARKRAGFHFQDFNNGFDYEINSDLFKTQIYTGQNVSFRCEGSPFYFAEGSRWTVRWKNSTFTTIGTIQGRDNRK